MAESAVNPAEPRKYVPHPPQSREQKVNAAKARHARGNKTALVQATQLQQALHSVGLMLEDDIGNSTDIEERARAASALAGVSKGWQSMNDQVRILKGKPLPGSLRPVSKEKKTKKESVAPMPEDSSTP